MAKAKRRQAWLVSFKHPDTSREGSVTFLDEVEAYRAAAEEGAQLAQDTIDSLDLDKEEVARLRSIVQLKNAGKFKEAYDEWHDYAMDQDPREDVLVEDTTVIG